MGRHDSYPEAEAAELARVLAEPAEDAEFRPIKRTEDLYGPISYSQLSDLDSVTFPRIEEEDWREEDRRRAERSQEDAERWDPVAGRWVT